MASRARRPAISANIIVKSATVPMKEIQKNYYGPLIAMEGMPTSIGQDVRGVPEFDIASGQFLYVHML